MTNEANENTGAKIAIGQIINGYTIVQQIEKSSVYLAFKDHPDNQVALKIFYPDPYACNHDEILERLRAITGLEHKNIVNVYEVGEAEDFIYAVMEYVPGENLYELLQKNPRLHWAAAGEFAREITCGLVTAHAKNVTHRSLHPDRVILGKDGQIKVNFCNEGEITPSSEIVHFVAPELFLGQALEGPSDVYSLGTLIYSIVTGKPPLAGKSPREIALKHREMAPVLPSYGVADIPHTLSLIISRSLSKELKQRYRCSYELLAAINNFLLNDKGRYKLGAYKQLLPKVVDVSQSGKAFTEALNLERDKRKVNEEIEQEEAGTDTEELMKEMEAATAVSQPIPREKNEPLSPLYKKVIIGAAISLLVNITLLIFLLL